MSTLKFKRTESFKLDGEYSTIANGVPYIVCRTCHYSENDSFWVFWRKYAPKDKYAVLGKSYSNFPKRKDAEKAIIEDSFKHYKPER